MVKRRIRSSVVTVIVTFCVGTVFHTNKLIRCREHAWLRKIMLMIETYSLQERVCLFVCLFCFVLFPLCNLYVRTLSVVHTSGTQSLPAAMLLKNDVHLHDRLSLEYHSFNYFKINKRKWAVLFINRCVSRHTVWEALLQITKCRVVEWLNKSWTEKGVEGSGYSVVSGRHAVLISDRREWRISRKPTGRMFLQAEVWTLDFPNTK